MGRHQLVKKKDKEKIKSQGITFSEVRDLEENFKEELQTNPKYSLEIDPLNTYHFSQVEKEFIKGMIDYKSLKFVAGVLLNMDLQDAVSIYNEYAVQEEIKRINLAMYARRFASKMADLDSLGGFLTTALTDENVPIADRLTGKEKLAAVRLLMELNQIKAGAYQNPEIIDVTAIETEIKNLKVDDIKLLIENSSEDDEISLKKNEIISKIDFDGLLTPEEITYLRTLSIEELEKIYKEINEKGDNDENSKNAN